uniref:Uncharacterized protein n=1 Tax=Arundo donax TaxID=35708 RepID=A0A0A8Z3Z0_ARUDO
MNSGRHAFPATLLIENLNLGGCKPSSAPKS